jgi:predicted enzyme related to lactoylglutathione lyase
MTAATPAPKTILVPVQDPARAKPVYQALLGVEPVADAPYYVGYQVGDTHLGLVPNGADQGLTGPVAYWHVADIRAALDALVGAGGAVAQDVHNVGGTRLIALVKDVDGNLIGLLQD